RLQIVDLALHEGGGVEDAMPSVHHVVVEGNDHERGVGDHTAELARVERPEAHGLRGPEGAEARHHVVGVEDLEGTGCWHRLSPGAAAGGAGVRRRNTVT